MIGVQEKNVFFNFLNNKKRPNVYEQAKMQI